MIFGDLTDISAKNEALLLAIGVRPTDKGLAVTVVRERA